MSRELSARPLAIAVIGASGDLAVRKIFPALFALDARGGLPPDTRFFGFARSALSEEAFRDRLAPGLRCEELADDVCGLRQQEFLPRCRYVQGDYGNAGDFARLRREVAATCGPAADVLYYFAIPPALFGPVAQSMRDAGILRGEDHGTGWDRVVVEKPFGRDRDTSDTLSAVLKGCFREEQIFRIDHYLGKDTVQNIMAFRLGNGIFEPLFNRRYVDHVQITAAEDIGVESGRGGYYDEAGALRDVFQNHLLQLLCLVAMEPPSVIGAKEVRDEKAKVLSAIRALGPVDTWAVRGQYGPGEANGEPVPGYRQEERVAEDSQTETFVAARLQVENWRWAGVPFFLRTGKRMPSKSTRIVVVFKRPPAQYFRTVTCVGDVCSLSPPAPNALVFDIQPNEGVHLYLWVKRPGMNMDVHQVDMSFRYDEAFPGKLPDAYERLLVDVMRGDQTLFARSDEIERAWAIVSPALSHWAGTEASFPNYAAGTWGPEAADRLFPAGSGWLNEGV